MGNDASPGKGQHYVPRFYLARFAGDDERVAMHRFRRPVKRVHPLNVAKENHYNSVLDADGRMDTSPEAVITQYIDAPTAPVLGRLVSGESITIEEQVQLALFIAFQFYRAPPRKAEVTKQLDERAQQSFRDMVLGGAEYKGWLERADSTLTPAQETEFQDLVRVGALQVSTTNASWLDYAFSRARHIAPRLVNERGWSLIRAPKHFEFITSDDPVTHYVISGPRDFDDVTVWFKPGVMTVFPLDPHHCIGIHQRPNGRICEVSAPQARDLNRVTVQASGRMVFSSRRQPWVETVLRKREAIRLREQASDTV